MGFNCAHGFLFQNAMAINLATAYCELKQLDGADKVLAQLVGADLTPQEEYMVAMLKAYLHIKRANPQVQWHLERSHD